MTMVSKYSSRRKTDLMILKPRGRGNMILHRLSTYGSERIPDQTKTLRDGVCVKWSLAWKW